MTLRNSNIFAIAVVLACAPAKAQTPDTGSPAQKSQSVQAPGVIGAFDNGKEPVEFAPMTQPERFRYYVRTTYGLGGILSTAAGAGIHQLTDTPKEWDQGAEGYGRRFGSAYATRIIQGTLEYGGSLALREDNRYVPSRETGLWNRSKHALVSTLTARNDAGHEHFAYSHVGGAAGAAFISRIWQPHSTNTAGDGAVTFGIIMAADAGGNMFKEFWPDVKRHLFRKRN